MGDGGAKGCFVAIVGPSGSGKDTLIEWLRERLKEKPGCMFVRRIVTRAADAQAEDHLTMSEAEFDQARSAGSFAVVWQAHGLSYGIPTEAAAHVANDGLAIGNGSRRALAAMRAAFGRFAVIELTVKPEILAQRLAQRGRESADEISARLALKDIGVANDFAPFRVDNSGSIDDAGETVLAYLATLSHHVGEERKTEQAK